MQQPRDAIPPFQETGLRGPFSDARILIAEDEVIIALELQDIFTDAGAEFVAVANTVDEALAAIEHDRITVGILDVRLGIGLIGPVAELLIHRGIPFLFYTGQPKTDHARAPWPDVPSVDKPASESRLLSAVHDLLHPHGRPDHLDR